MLRSKYHEDTRQGAQSTSDKVPFFVTGLLLILHPEKKEILWR
jgi:hypothetical protein